jgi:predicted permease
MREIRISGIRRVLRVWTRAGIARDVDEEIRFHLDARADELMRAGLLEGEAHRRAREEYGDVERSRRELLRVDRRRTHHAEREELLVSFIEDVRYAARGFARRPALLLITTTALCIGIAANAIMFGVVDQLLLRAPSGVTAPEQVKRVYLRETNDGTTSSQPITAYPLITALQQGVPAFSELAAFYRGTYSLGRGADARSVDVELVTGNYLNMLGVTPVIGRGFAPGEDTIPRGERVAVVSHGFWRGELGADRSAVGRSLHLAGNDYTIIGVAPEAFSGLDRRNVDLWVPISAMGAEEMGDEWHLSPGNWWVQAVGRLDTAASLEIAEAQATTVFREQLREWKQQWRDSSGTIVLGSIVGTRAPDGMTAEAKVSLWLMGVSLIVLLIACANVANLLIARAFDRRREIAVRLALGVSRGRLLRMLLTEAALLAVFAATAAMVVAYWGSRFVQGVLLPGIVWAGGVLDGRVLAFTLLVTVLCIVLAGSAPALQSMGLKLSNSLKSGARQVGASRSGLRHALLGLQAALSIVLLIGAGLFVRSLHNVQARVVGIDLDRVLMITMSLSRAGFDAPRIAEIHERARDRLLRMPGIERAVVVRGTVPMRTANGFDLTIPGTESPDLEGGGPYGAGVPPEFFATLGARITRGRNFLPEESRVPSRVMIVNELVADAYWPGGDAVGQCVTVEGDDRCTEVVGVVENVMLFSLVRDDRALIYMPPAHPAVAERTPSALLVRTASDAQELIPSVGREIQRLAADMPHVNVRPYSELVAPQLRPWRLGATMFTLFGTIALVIAAVGLYSVMAYWVGQRTQEIGVRMALGAQRDSIVRMVVWQTSRAVVAGLIVGALVAALASRWLADLLYEISPRDPLVYGGAAAALAVAAVIASVVPARRSTAVDPVLALRAE